MMARTDLQDELLEKEPLTQRDALIAEQLQLPKELLRRAPLYIFLHALLPFLCITGSLFLARLSDGPWHQFLLVHFALLLAAQRCFQTLVHDCAHLFFHRTKRLNDFLANSLAAGWIGSTVEAYRVIHFKHHLYNGSKDDPEFIDFEVIQQKGGLGRFIFRYIACLEAVRLVNKYYGKKEPSSIGLVNDAGWHLGGLLKNKLHIIVVQLFLLSLFVGVGQTVYLYLLWLYIALSWSPLISGLRFLVEHPGKSNRTVSTISWLLEKLYFAPYHFNYHFEHHVWPSIPPYQLKRIHRYLDKQDYFKKHPEFLNDATYVGSLWRRKS